MLAMVVNDDAGCLDASGVWTAIASMLAPTPKPLPRARASRCRQNAMSQNVSLSFSMLYDDVPVLHDRPTILIKWARSDF